MAILGYANKIMLENNQPARKERAYRVISAMKYNFFDSKKAGLTAACWEIISGN
jgi:hypothetical protein